MMPAVDWEALYCQGETPWDKGSAAPGLVDFLQFQPDLKRGRVLVPGCGLGHDAREWANAGFDVTGLDLAPTAVRVAQGRIGRGRLRFECGNFFEHRDSRGYDVIFEHTLFCAIPVESRPLYVASIRRLLRPGGHFVAVHYLNPRDPTGPPFGVSRGEILDRFSVGMQLVAEWVPRSFPGREGRERLCWWRRDKKSFDCEQV